MFRPANTLLWPKLTAVRPVLAPGVVVHFHDVFWPFEYPPDWALGERRGWNEATMVKVLGENWMRYLKSIWGQ